MTWPFWYVIALVIQVLCPCSESENTHVRGTEKTTLVGDDAAPVSFLLSGMAVDKSSVVRFVLVLLMRLSAFATGFSSRGQMSSGVPYFAGPDHRVVLVGDFLSWDSADYKVAQALEIVGTVEDLLVLQLDEVEGDLLALQLRSFDPTIVLISVRTRAYEHLVLLVEHVARTESRRGEDVVVAVCTCRPTPSPLLSARLLVPLCCMPMASTTTTSMKIGQPVTEQTTITAEI